MLKWTAACCRWWKRPRRKREKRRSIGERPAKWAGRKPGWRWPIALQAGAGSQTKIHGVGDGAVWIIEQMEAQFGSQAQYLIDFCHVCDYLAAAAEVIAGNDKPAWMEEKKDWLKDNRWKDVLHALRSGCSLSP